MTIWEFVPVKLSRNLYLRPVAFFPGQLLILIGPMAVYRSGTSVSEAKTKSNYTTYGVLYNWTAAYSACPSGWHLPTDAEWTILTNYLGSDSGIKAKAASGWELNGNGNNSSGFNILPGGGIWRGVTASVGKGSVFLTQPQGNSGLWIYSVSYNTSAIIRGPAEEMADAFSIRCVKN
jgi:uncharacterized protein (TIGR02145 family)